MKNQLRLKNKKGIWDSLRGIVWKRNQRAASWWVNAETFVGAILKLTHKYPNMMKAIRGSFTLNSWQWSGYCLTAGGCDGPRDCHPCSSATGMCPKNFTVTLPNQHRRSYEIGFHNNPQLSIFTKYLTLAKTGSFKRLKTSGVLVMNFFLNLL